MFNVEVLGFIAMVFTTIATLPQIIKMVKTKSVGDISIMMCILFCVGFTIWIIYGVLKGSLSLIIGNCISIFCYSVIIFCALKWRNR